MAVDELAGRHTVQREAALDSGVPLAKWCFECLKAVLFISNPSFF
jgi:predicted GNAT superfamily acetyltransferase